MLLREAAFGVAFLLSSSLTWIVIRLCYQKGWLFHPCSDRWSRRSVAKFGGVPILLSFLSVAQFLPITFMVRVILMVTAGIAIIGLWDDLKPFPPLWKLFAQFGFAAIAVSAGVLYPLGTHPVVNYAFTLFWIVGITNAFNLLDNMDGLSSGVAFIAALNLVLLVHGKGDTVAALPFAGALLGFLLFNFSPAKIFMGDVGSLAIGFFLACISVATTQNIGRTLSVLSIPVLVVFLPIFDTLLVSITRRLNGKAISAGARDHSSHRLVLLGLTERSAVLILYSIAALGGAIAYLSNAVWPEAGTGFVALFLLGAALFWFYLAQMKLPEDWLSRTNVATLVIPEFLNSIGKRAVLFFIDAAMIVLSLYLAFLLRFSGTYGGISLFLGLCAGSLLIKLTFLAIFGAYRHKHSAHSLHLLYPVVKSTLLGSMSLVAALALATRFVNLSRAVLLLDFVFSTGLLCLVRAANPFFDHLLNRPATVARCVLVGDGSAELFQHYFAWKQPGASVVGIVATSPISPSRRIIAPIVELSELPAFLLRERISDVYLLPDCSPEAGGAALGVASPLGIEVHSFQLKTVRVSKSPELQAKAARQGGPTEDTKASRQAGLDSSVDPVYRIERRGRNLR